MQNIELQDMMAIIHGLRMSGLSFVEPDALDEINSRIKDLPSSEALTSVYSDPREVKRLCAEVGRTMELIDHYGTRNEEYKARYKAKTNLPPRYKNLKWKAASKNMKIRTAQEIPQASTEMEAMAQQLKDLESELLTTQQELTTFSTRINADLPNLSAQVPAQYQPIFQQYAVVVNEATNALLNKTMMLIQGIQMIQNSTAGVQSVLQENEVMMSQFIANSSYIKNIVKLSKNLEGNGLISEKLLNYAKNLKNRDIKANYDLLEINALLRHSNMSNEADTLIKTAGIWDKVKDKFKGKQNIPAGYGLIDPGEQTGSQWETGNLETQFANDVDWLKRSWDNLVDFFGRYVRDANTLVSEWQGRESPEKVAKINELKEQAQIMLNNVQKIQQSNFTSKLMGNDLFGASEKSDETPDEEVSETPDPSIEVGDWYEFTGSHKGNYIYIKNISGEDVTITRREKGSPDREETVNIKALTNDLESKTIEKYVGEDPKEVDQTRLKTISKDDISEFHKRYKNLFTLTKSGKTNFKVLREFLSFLQKIKQRGGTTATSLNFMIKEAVETVDFNVPFLQNLYRGQWTVGNLDGAISELQEAINTETEGKETEKEVKKNLQLQMRNYDIMFNGKGFKSKFIYDNFYSGRQSDFINDLAESMEKEVPIDQDLQTLIADYNSRFTENKISTKFIIENDFDRIDSLTRLLNDAIKKNISIGSNLEKLTAELKSMDPFYTDVRKKILNNQFYGIDFNMLDSLLELIGKWQNEKGAKTASKKEKFNLRLASTALTLENLFEKTGIDPKDGNLTSFISNRISEIDTAKLRDLFQKIKEYVESTRSA